MNKLPLLIVGAGAAGYFAAITAKLSEPAREVILAESGKDPLRKVRISGGGRCNVTHSCFDPAQLIASYPRGSRELRGPFSKFQPRDTMAWFEERGVRLKIEADGRVFPESDSSETIIDCLEQQRRNAGVELRLGSKLETLERLSTGEFRAIFRHGTDEGEEFFQGVILTTGGAPSGYEISASLGHTIEACVPSLFTFQIKDSRLDGLAGISVPVAEVCLRIRGKKDFEERGPLLITHWGLSGPGIIRTSAWCARELFNAGYQAELLVNFFPNIQTEALLRKHKQDFPKRTIASEPPLPMAKRLWERLVQAAGIPEDCRYASLTKEQITALTAQVHQARFQVGGKGVFKEEFVTCGGVRLREVDFRTMQSKLVPGLFFAGELLDIDGITGGFNFQSAWTTGWLAGTSI